MNIGQIDYISYLLKIVVYTKYIPYILYIHIERDMYIFYEKSTHSPYIRSEQMEARKVQKTGTSTITVSLPKDWVTANGIKPGDSVSMEVQPDGTLNVEPEIRRDKVTDTLIISIDRNEPTEHITRKLIGAYLAGSTIIEVRSTDRMGLDVKRSIKDFARLVIGPEVIEETSSTVVLHDLSDPVELPQKKCVRRMHLIVDSMHRDAMVAYSEGDAELAKDVLERDQDVDRLYWMTVKQHALIMDDRRLAKRLGVDVHGSLSLLLAARILERVGDHAEKIAQQALGAAGEEKPPTVAEMREFSSRAVEMLKQAVESFFIQDVVMANAVIDESRGTLEEGGKLQPRLQGTGGKGTMSRTAVMDSLVRTIMYATDVAEIAINDAMRHELKKKG
jgi:phosphate uptake regulator